MLLNFFQKRAPRQNIAARVFFCAVIGSGSIDAFFAAEVQVSAPGSAAAVETLKIALEHDKLWGAKLSAQPFVKTPLTKADAAKTRELLWKEHAARISSEREAELQAGLLKLAEHEMPFTLKSFGEKPEAGWSLWISLHGGGSGPKAVNDQQWENQKRLYKLKEGLYLVPRAPTNTWNMWHEPHIDAMFERLIADLIVLKQVDPNRVYVLGYSAGGDGVYQLAPRMADHWASAAMMAGHPNDASPLGLRNVAFAIQAGGLDAAYDRNKIAKQWIGKLDLLQTIDPGGYVHFGKIFEQKAHWMDGEDAKVLPWMAGQQRNPVPERIVWKQSPVTHERMYWLALPEGQAAVSGAEICVERKGRNFEITSASDVKAVALRLDERMCDLDETVRVKYRNQNVFEGKVQRTIAAQLRALEPRGDPQLIFDAEIDVKLTD